MCSTSGDAFTLEVSTGITIQLGKLRNTITEILQGPSAGVRSPESGHASLGRTFIQLRFCSLWR